MSLSKRLIAIVLAVILGVSLLGATTVMAAAPSITGVSIDPDPAYTDTTLKAIPDGWNDDDGDDEGYQWQWQILDGVDWLPVGDDSDTLDSSNFDVGDEIKVICTPFDGAEAGTPVEDTITISGPIVTITPDPAYTDTPLVAVPMHWVGGETFEFQWQILDGVDWLPVGDDSDTLDYLNFVKDDQIKVICTPYIDETPGTAVEDTITISNSAPSIESLTIEPNPASTDSTLEAIPDGWADADGDEEGYQWQWQKYNTDTSTWEDIPGATESTLESSNFELNDQIKVICTPDDGTDTGEPMEATIIISILNYDAGIDVKPGSEENPINLKSKGVIPVAVYTTEGFDATLVDIETVVFGPAGAGPVHFAYEDIDEDGDIDLILHFRTQETGITEDDTEATLSGMTESGTSFTGTNVIKIVPLKAQEKVQGNEAAPGQSQEPGDNAGGDAEEKVQGNEVAPGQNKEPGEKAEGKAKGKDK
jgi:hypothetical protein